jgi:hypothetical protein
VSLGEKAVLASSGQPGKVAAWVGRVRREDFFNVWLIGVAYAALAYQLQKLQPRLRLTAEGA